MISILQSWIREEFLNVQYKEWTEGSFSVTKVEIGNIKSWVTRKWGQVSHQMCQFLSGHGCFMKYVEANGKENKRYIHTVILKMIRSILTLFHCHKWDDERNDLQEKLHSKLQVENFVDKMLGSEENWEMVEKFIRKIIAQKEKDEREEEQEGRRF